MSIPDVKIELDRSQLEVVYDAGQIVAVTLRDDMGGSNILPWLNLATVNRIKTEAALQLDRLASSRRPAKPYPAGAPVSIRKETT